MSAADAPGLGLDAPAPHKRCPTCSSPVWWRYGYQWRCWVCVPDGRRDANCVHHVGDRMPAWLDHDVYWDDNVLPPSRADWVWSADRYPPIVYVEPDAGNPAGQKQGNGESLGVKRVRLGVPHG